MKKLLLVLFVAVITLNACKKDNEDSSEGKLQGRWDTTKEYYLEKKNGVKIDESSDTFEIGDEYIVFEGNNYVSYDNGVADEKGTFKATQNSLTMTTQDLETNTYGIKWISKTEFIVIIEDTYKDGNDVYSEY